MHFYLTPVGNGNMVSLVKIGYDLTKQCQQDVPHLGIGLEPTPRLLRKRSAENSLRALLLVLASPLSHGSSKDPGKVIAGWVEKISFGKEPLITKAKLDSGAKTSSIHAANIEQFKRKGARWVRFDLILEDTGGKIHKIHMEKPKARRVRIKTNDESVDDLRSVVELEFCFDGRPRKTEFTLADRSEFIYDILLGREFLAGTAVIDPQSTFLTMARCP
jgi:hypothetical protein